MSDDFSPSSLGATALISQEERLFAAACHFAGLPFFTAFALMNIAAPLVIWLLKKDTMPFVDAHGKESLNFQITAVIAYAVSGVLVCFGVGVPLVLAVAVLQIIFPIMGSIAAYDGKSYRYPLILRIVT